MPTCSPSTPTPAERRDRYGEVLSLADGTAVQAILSHFQAALPETGHKTLQMLKRYTQL